MPARCRSGRERSRQAKYCITAGRIWETAARAERSRRNEGAISGGFTALEQGDLLCNRTFLILPERELDEIAGLEEAGSLQRSRRNKEVCLAMAHNEAIALADVVPLDETAGA